MLDNYGVDNRIAYNRLIDALANHPVAAFVGAGFSMRIGYPSWNEFLRMLKDRACELQPDETDRLNAILGSDDKLAVAGEYKRILGESEFLSFATDIFGPQEPQYDQTHERLMSIPFYNILTTNYDPVLACAYANVYGKEIHSVTLANREESEPLYERIADARAEPNLIHVHGSVGHPENLILTLDDYDELYVAGGWAERFLQSVFYIYSLVFVGFGMADSDLMGNFRIASVLAGSGESKHYALIGCTDPATTDATKLELRQRYRIEPIFYDASNKHESLGPLLSQISSDTIRATQSHPRFIPEVQIQAVLEQVLDSNSEEVESVTCHLSELGHTNRHGLIIVDASTSGQERVPLDDEIDTIFKLVQAGRPDQAIVEYKDILERPGIGLSNRLKYRLHANIGNAFYRSGRVNEAANSFLEAVGQYKDTHDAIYHEALAYYLLNDYVKAREIATALCESEADFNRAHAIRLHTLIGDISLEDALTSVSNEAAKDAEVMLALSRIAGSEGDLASEESYLRAIIKDSPEWNEPSARLAAVIIIREKAVASIDIEQGLIVSNRERVLEAKMLLNAVIDNLPKHYVGPMAAGLYLNRSITNRMLDKDHEAHNDVLKAYELEPSDPEISMAWATELAIGDQLEDAIKCMKDVFQLGQTSRLDLQLAVFLADQGSRESIREATQIADYWIEHTGNLEQDAYINDLLTLYCRLYIQQDKACEAINRVLSLPPGTLSTQAIAIVNIRISINGGDTEQAKQLLIETTNTLAENDDWFLRRDLAVLAGRLEQWSIAQNLFKTIAPDGRFNIDTRMLLKAAHNAGDDAFVLEYCRQLRETGIHERLSYELEIDALYRNREPERAIELLQQWLEKNPDDKDMRLSLSIVAVEERKSELVESDPQKLPAVSEVPNSSRGAAVAHVLRYGVNPTSGADYSYDLWRRFPDDLESRRSLAYCIVGIQHPGIVLEHYSTAMPGAAVLLKNEHGTSSWYFIEPGMNPSMSMNEYSPEHQFAKAILGRGLQEVVDYGGNKFIIEAIDHRYIVRAYEIMESFEQLFPEDSPIKKVRIPDGIEATSDPLAALGDMWKILQADEARREQILGIHQDRRVPVAMVAKWLGRRTVDAMVHLATTPNTIVYCSLGTYEEWNSAYSYLEKPTEIVIDATAAASIILLGIHEVVANEEFKFVIPRSVLGELQDSITEMVSLSKGGGIMGSYNDEFYIRDYTTDYLAEEIQKIEIIIECLRTHCEVLGGEASLKLDQEHRDKLLNAVKPATTDAIAIATDRKAVLWTDDLAIASVASGEFGIPRIWTHVLLRKYREKGMITKKLYVDSYGDLLVYGYSHTGLSIIDILLLFQSVEWQLRSNIGQGILKQASQVGTINDHNIIIYIFVTLGVWKYCPNESHAREIIISLLEGMGHSRSGPLIARRIYRLPYANLNMKHPKARRLKKLLRNWRSTQHGGIN